jgi:hypothetical protein
LNLENSSSSNKQQQQNHLSDPNHVSSTFETNPFSSLDRFYRNQRNSIKSFAPIAPTVLKPSQQQPQQQQQQQTKVTLVPYDTDHVPPNYLRDPPEHMPSQKTTTTNHNLNYFSLQLDRNKPSGRTKPGGQQQPQQQQQQQQAPLVKLDALVASSTSVLDVDKTSSSAQMTKSTLTEKPKQSSSSSSSRRSHASRKSVVKINLDKPLPLDLLYDGIQTGIGLAYNLSVATNHGSVNTSSLSSSNSSIMI